jgi:asparagine N-glycosylation enzyme membrane subunit Stt3
MFAKLFLPALELWRFLIYFPALLASLMAIPMYFIGKALYDRRAGVLAAFFIVFDMAILSRTLGGDPDTDAFTLLVPLITIAVFLYAYKYIDRVKKIDKGFIAYTILLGLTLFLWSQSWAGYSYVIWIMGGFIVLKLIIDFVTMRRIKEAWNNSKHFIACFLIAFLLFSVPIILFLEGPLKVTSGILGPFEFQNIKTEEGRQFPNVGVSVAELQSAGSPGDIIRRTSALQDPGMILLISPFALMIFGLGYLIYSYIAKRQHLDTMILLLIWFLGPFLATITAVRFSILFSAPIAIGSAIFLAKLMRMASGEDKKLED